MIKRLFGKIVLALAVLSFAGIPQLIAQSRIETCDTTVVDLAQMRRYNRSSSICNHLTQNYEPIELRIITYTASETVYVNFGNATPTPSAANSYMIIGADEKVFEFPVDQIWITPAATGSGVVDFSLTWVWEKR